MNDTIEIHQKSINNAVSAYLMILISGTFLLNSSNEYLKNDFVRSHTKVAFMTHLSFLLTFIIFVWFNFLQKYAIFGFSLNYIIATVIFISLFLFLLYGIYSATQGKKIAIGDVMTLAHTERIADINGDSTVDEKDLITLILAHIPFIGYVVYGLYSRVDSVKKITHVNLLTTLIITGIFILGYANIALLLCLLYIIFIVFSGINILINGKIVGINAGSIPSPEEKIILQKTLIQYMKNYFGKKEDFTGFVDVKKQILEKRKKLIELKLKSLEGASEYRLPLFLIYIPFINLITLVSMSSKYNTHIINGFYITLICTGIIILNIMGFVTLKLLLFMLFPICFGIGYVQVKKCYIMPYIYDFHLGLLKVFSFSKRTKTVIAEKKKEEHQTTYSVGDDLHGS